MPSEIGTVRALAFGAARLQAHPSTSLRAGAVAEVLLRQAPERKCPSDNDGLAFSKFQNFQKIAAETVKQAIQRKLDDNECRRSIWRISQHMSRSQMRRHSGCAAASATRPSAPVTTVALCAPMRSASQPSQTKPIGPVPMQTESTPRMRERMWAGAAR